MTAVDILAKFMQLQPHLMTIISIDRNTTSNIKTKYNKEYSDIQQNKVRTQYTVKENDNP